MITSAARQLATALVVVAAIAAACAPGLTGSVPPSARSAQLPAGCAAVPGDGDVVRVGTTPVSVLAPQGWRLMLDLGDPDPRASSSQGAVVSQHDPHLTLDVLIQDADSAEAFAMIEDPPTGTAIVVIRGIGAVSVDRIMDGTRHGLRYRQSIGANVVQVKALGPAGVCDETLVAILGLVILP